MNRLALNERRLFADFDDPPAQRDFNLHLSRADAPLEEVGISASIRATTAEDEEVNTVMAMAGVDNDPIVLAMCFKACGDAEDAKDKLQQLLYKTTGFVSSVNRKADKFLDSLDFKWRIREDKVWLFASANPASEFASIIPAFNSILEHYLDNVSNPQEASTSIKFAASPSDLINIPSSILCFEPLLEAFDIDIKANIWSGFFKVFQSLA